MSAALHLSAPLREYTVHLTSVLRQRNTGGIVNVSGNSRTRSALLAASVLIGLAMIGCGADTTAPFESVVGLEFLSAAGVRLSEVWAPAGQTTVVTVVARDANGAMVTDPRVSVHLADASAAELLVLPATAADSGRVRLEVRGTRLGAQTRLIALAANGVADTTMLEVPLVGGVYDVTTRLQTFSFETPAPSPPDCPSYTLYCTHTRAFDGASLTGTLTITRDSVYGNFAGLFCSAWTLDGCTAVSAKAPEDYPYYSADKVVAGAGFSTWVGGGQRSNVRLSAMASGDSLYGSVYWAQYVTRSPPAHRGTFVARLRR